MQGGPGEYSMANSVFHEVIYAGSRNAYSRVALREVELMVNSLSRIGTDESHGIAGRILDKLDLSSRVQAVILAYEAGWVSAGRPRNGGQGFPEW